MASMHSLTRSNLVIILCRLGLTGLLLCTGACAGAPQGDYFSACPRMPGDEQTPYDNNAPPTYVAEDWDTGPSAPLYAPEAVTPSRGRGVPDGPVVVMP